MTNKIATSIVNKKLCAQKLVKVAHEAATVPSIFGAGDLLGGLKLGDPQTPSAAEGQAWADLQKSWRDKGLPEANFDWSKQPELARSLARNSAGMPALPPAQSPLTPAQYAQKIPDKRIPEIKATSDPRPAPPAPKTFRGQGSIGAPGFIPHLADKFKTQQQLDAEQNVNGTPRYSFVSSVGNAGVGLMGLLGGAAKNIPLTAGRALGYATDSAGLTNNWYKDFTESAAIAQDMRDRGFHQLINPRTSTAYSDQYGSSGNVAQQMLADKDPNYNSHSARAAVGDAVGPVLGWTAAPVAAKALGLPAAAASAVGLVSTAAPLAADFSETVRGKNPPGTNQLIAALENPANFSEIKPGQFALNMHGIGKVPLSDLSPENMNIVLQQYPALEQILADSGQYPSNAMTASDRVNLVALPTDAAQSAQNVSGELRQAQQPVQPAAPEQKPAPRRPFDDDQTDGAVANNTATTGQQAAPAPIPGLPTDAAPEVVQQAEQSRAVVSENPIAKPAVSDPNSPERQQALDTGRQTLEQQLSPDYMKTNPPPPQPQDFGKWLNGMTSYMGEMWESLGPMGQLAVGLGVPLGLIGLMGDGIGSFLMSAVGLGAAGTALASAGVFGDTAQQGVNSVLGGVMPENEAPTNQAASNGVAQSSVPGTATNNNSSAALSAPAAKPPAAEQIDGTIRALAASKNPVADIQDEKNAPVLQHLGRLAQESPEDLRTQFAALPPDVQTGLTTNLQQILANYGPGTLAHMALNADQKRKILMLQNVVNLISTPEVKKSNDNYIRESLIPKIARCWKGYEPVPGKKPYTNGSCRPQGSKKKKQMKKKSSDTYALTQLPALLNTIRGYYVKQAYTQSTQIRPQSRPQTGA